MSKKLKKKLVRIVVCAIAFMVLLVSSHLYEAFLPQGIAALGGHDNIIWLVLFFALYIGIGGDIIKSAFSSIIHGQMLDENFLMVLASIGAFFIGSYDEGVAVVLLFQIGEWFQSYAVGKSRKSIKELMDIRPDYANVIRDGEEETVDPDEVEIDEIIVIRPGEKIPLDGVVVEGNSTIDTMALTGESVPREVGIEGSVISGCVNLSGVIKVKVTSLFTESTVSKILTLVETATEKKAESENFITKFARWYTPCIVGIAVVMAVVAPLITGDPFMKWLYRALELLVISCPCALVISIPLSFFGGIGGASKEGILVKGSSYIEQLSKAEVVAMDKTGTLTKGEFKVHEIIPVDEKLNEELTKDKKDNLLEIAAIAESYSSHPIAQSLLQAYGKEIDKARLSDVTEIAGRGVSARVDGTAYFVGNHRLLEDQGIAYNAVSEIGTVVYVADDSRLLGYIIIRDNVKDDAKACIEGLKAAGVRKTVMLTGDRDGAAKYVADGLGVSEYHAELLPGDKVSIVEQLLSNISDKGKLVFVGDGINDAPVLARADIGIAMGGLGSDAAIEAADVVIMTDEPSKIAKAMKISRKTLGIVKQNIIFAIGVKVLILILATFGIASMWAAIFADVGVAFLAILNAMRAMNVK